VPTAQPYQRRVGLVAGNSPPSAIALESLREREESTPPDNHLHPGDSDADRVIAYQPVFPFRWLTVITKYGWQGGIDRSGALLHCLADRHDGRGPRNRDSETEEAEHQADGAAERSQRADVLSAERHSRELNLVGH